jgi:ABC-type cobalamin/Fe3+-siderophores transport system ATPase subunit
MRNGKWIEARELPHSISKTQTVYDLSNVANGNQYITGTEISHNCSMLLLDEFAFVPNNTADEFFASVYPTISSGKESKIAIISTPNGMNHFYKLVKDAE